MKPAAYIDLYIKPYRKILVEYIRECITKLTGNFRDDLIMKKSESVPIGHNVYYLKDQEYLQEFSPLNVLKVLFPVEYASNKICQSKLGETKNRELFPIVERMSGGNNYELLMKYAFAKQKYLLSK